MFIGRSGDHSTLARWLLSILVSERKEDNAMNKKILVPLGQNDRAEEIIPYVEKVARPGMEVVFLVRYPVDGFIWAKEEFGMKAALEAKKLVHYYSWEENLHRAAEKLSSACAVLRPKGIEVAVDLYAGNMRSAVRDYTAKGDIHLIVTRAGIGQRIAGFLNGSNSLFDLFRRPAVSPVLLIHPGVAA
jgi:hypothetical protein